MHLSDKEKRMVKRLKKEQQSLIRCRWVGLISALLSIAAGCYCVVILERLLQKPDLPAILIIANLLPLIYVLVGTGLGLVAYLVLRWNVKPKTILLLRLIEESNDDPSLNDAADLADRTVRNR